jgi:hypothetical protein
MTSTKCNVIYGQSPCLGPARETPYSDQGVFILSIDDEDEEDLNISPDKTQAMLGAFLKADPWRQKR